MSKHNKSKGNKYAKLTIHIHFSTCYDYHCSSFTSIISACCKFHIMVCYCPCLPDSVLNELTLVACNQLRWLYLHHGNWQTVQTVEFFFFFLIPECSLNICQHFTEKGLSNEVIFEQMPELDVGIAIRISGGEQYRHRPQTSLCLTWSRISPANSMAVNCSQ